MSWYIVLTHGSNRLQEIGLSPMSIGSQNIKKEKRKRKCKNGEERKGEIFDLNHASLGLFPFSHSHPKVKDTLLKPT